MIKQLTKGLIFTVVATLPFSAHAHRAWLLPSTTVLSGDTPWVTVDAAVSNDLFYFEHVPLVLEGVAALPAQNSSNNARARPSNRLVITAPDGTEVPAQNGHVGKYRSVFDVELAQKGTYKLAVASTGRYLAHYTEKGEKRRWMGTPDQLAHAIPDDAENVQVSEVDSRMELFITSGNPTDSVFQTTGKGLEMKPVTHPNDLFAGETSEFIFLLDGKPAAGAQVTVIPGGIRHRDQLNDIKLTADANGKVSIPWPSAGFWWMEATVVQKEGLSEPVDQRRSVYTSTLEVMAP